MGEVIVLFQSGSGQQDLGGTTTSLDLDLQDAQLSKAGYKYIKHVQCTPLQAYIINTVSFRDDDVCPYPPRGQIACDWSHECSRLKRFAWNNVLSPVFTTWPPKSTDQSIGIGTPSVLDGPRRVHVVADGAFDTGSAAQASLANAASSFLPNFSSGRVTGSVAHGDTERGTQCMGRH